MNMYGPEGKRLNHVRTTNTWHYVFNVYLMTPLRCLLLIILAATSTNNISRSAVQQINAFTQVKIIGWVPIQT